MRLIITFTVAFLISCSPKPKSEFLTSNPEFAATFEGKINSLYEKYALQGDFIIGIVTEQGLVFSYALNRDILEGRPSPLTDDSPIYVASHTKSFTGTLLKILEEEGLVDLNRSLYDYLPELIFDGTIDTKSITVRQLLNHTHGIHSTQFQWKTAFLGYDGGNEELIRTLNSDFRYDPSHQFRYSNVGPVIASMIVDKVCASGWKEEMRQRIFLPLKMHYTYSSISSLNRDEIRPAIQMRRDHQIFQSGFYKDDKTMSAAGGTISTISDLSKWLRFNINADLSIIRRRASFDELHKKTANQDRTYFTYQREGYSLGWDIAKYQGDTLLTRFGGYAGISFHLSFIPARNTGIVAFSNEDDASSLPHLAANYAYNLLANKADSEKIFEAERLLFEEAYQRTGDAPLPSKEMKVAKSVENDLLVGAYRNNLGWPDIHITSDGPDYSFNWGVLSGSIYAVPDPERPYVSSLGPMMRSFKVSRKNGVVDSLFTGSLRYSRMSR